MQPYLALVIIVYAFAQAYRARREELGPVGKATLAARLIEWAVGFAAAVWLGRAVDQPDVTNGSEWVQFSLVAASLYAFGVGLTGLLHVVNLLSERPVISYRAGWAIFVAVTASLLFILITGLAERIWEVPPRRSGGVLAGLALSWLSLGRPAWYWDSSVVQRLRRSLGDGTVMALGMSEAAAIAAIGLFMKG